MPANKYTIKAVEAILTCDMGVTALTRDNITRQLAKEPEAETTCTESEAARILDMSQTTLYNWRKGKWDHAPHPFWFRVWYTLTSEARYDIPQLRAYKALLMARSRTPDAPPDITEQEVTRFQELAETGK